MFGRRTPAVSVESHASNASPVSSASSSWDWWEIAKVVGGVSMCGLAYVVVSRVSLRRSPASPNSLSSSSSSFSSSPSFSVSVSDFSHSRDSRLYRRGDDDDDQIEGYSSASLAAESVWTFRAFDFSSIMSRFSRRTLLRTFRWFLQGLVVIGGLLFVLEQNFTRPLTAAESEARTAASVVTIRQVRDVSSLTSRWVQIPAFFVGLISTIAVRFATRRRTKLFWWSACNCSAAVLLSPVLAFPAPILINTALFSGCYCSFLFLFSVFVGRHSATYFAVPVAISAGALLITSLIRPVVLFRRSAAQVRSSFFERFHVGAGLLAFSLFLLFDIARLVDAAETYNTAREEARRARRERRELPENEGFDLQSSDDDDSDPDDDDEKGDGAARRRPPPSTGRLPSTAKSLVRARNDRTIYVELGGVSVPVARPDPVVASLDIYEDFINIFLRFLRLRGDDN